MPNNDYLELKELCHHGVKGQKWGIRKYENEDGTLTKEGLNRYKKDNVEHIKKRENIIKASLGAGIVASLLVGRQIKKSLSGDRRSKNEAFRLGAKKGVSSELFINKSKSLTPLQIKKRKRTLSLLGGSAGLMFIGLVINGVKSKKDIEKVKKTTLKSAKYMEHSGVKGQKWGVRRFQNEDGTLTDAGKARYNKEGVRYTSPTQMSDKELNDINRRLSSEQQYQQLVGSTQPGKAITRDNAIKIGATFVSTALASLLFKKYKTGSYQLMDKKKRKSTVIDALVAGSIGALVAGATSLGASSNVPNK